MNELPEIEYDSQTERERQELDDLGEDIPGSCQKCGMVTLGGALECECDEEND